MNSVIGEILKEISMNLQSINTAILRIAENTNSSGYFNWNAISSIATFFSTIGTFFLAFLTYKMVKEMKATRISESRPYIIIYLKFYEHTVYLICENIGKTVAKNVSVKFNNPLLGIERYDIQRKIFPKPIPSMPPGYKIKTFIDSSIEIEKDNSHLSNVGYTVCVNIKYSDDGINKNSYEEKYEIDLKSSQNILFTPNKETQMAESMDKIDKHVEAFLKNFYEMAKYHNK